MGILEKLIGLVGALSGISLQGIAALALVIALVALLRK